MDGTLLYFHNANLCPYGTGRREESNGGNEFMSAYNLTPTNLPFSSYTEAKEKRRKVLEAVRARRRLIYERYRKKVHNHVPLEFAA